MKTKSTNTAKTAAFYIPIDRRSFFKSMALTSAGFTLPGYLAEALTTSPIVTQGPYYPLASNIPLDKDNDLVQLNDNLTLASGIVSYISGRVFDSSGNPVRGALVELWHADREGDYLYSTSAARNPACDPNFAGFGQFLTGSTGAYRFRTIKAGLYMGRTHGPHKTPMTWSIRESRMPHNAPPSHWITPRCLAQPPARCKRRGTSSANSHR